MEQIPEEEVLNKNNMEKTTTEFLDEYSSDRSQNTYELKASPALMCIGPVHLSPRSNNDLKTLDSMRNPKKDAPKRPKKNLKKMVSKLPMKKGT